MKVVVVIPAQNEELSIAKVIAEIPDEYRQTVIVVDNGSIDQTARRAADAGAVVVVERERGYGAACLRGIEEARRFNPDVVVFLDADLSDHPHDMRRLLQHLEENSWDLVIGSRLLGLAEPGSLLPQARIGNWLATFIMSMRFGRSFTDLGPFRAIRFDALEALQMRDRTFGWTIEMQIKALRLGLRVGEVAVHYRKRIGRSKITGTVRGTILAGVKILSFAVWYSLYPLPRSRFVRNRNPKIESNYSPQQYLH